MMTMSRVRPTPRTTPRMVLVSDELDASFVALAVATMICTLFPFPAAETPYTSTRYLNKISLRSQ
jgi:hypothetical protein